MLDWTKIDNEKTFQRLLNHLFSIECNSPDFIPSSPYIGFDGGWDGYWKGKYPLEESEGVWSIQAKWTTKSFNEAFIDLKAVAETGGVIGIVTVPMFLGRVVEEEGRWKAGTLKEVLDHIDYAVNLVGVDHVGIGTDTADIPDQPEDARVMEGMNKMIHSFWYGFRPGPPPEGHEHGRGLHVYPPRPDSLEAWSNWPNITVGLVSRGYSDQEIEKIIGGNWLGLYEKVIG